jgi:hypothetical protein
VPSLEILKKGVGSNRDGIGLAWKAEGEIHFKKGIDFGELVQRLKVVARHKMPYIVHFRIATSGAKIPAMCHPFPIVFKTNNLFKLEGRAKAVLAHNGTWGRWREAIGDAELADQIEKNNWSDSAVMAWLLSQGKTVKLSKLGYGHRVAVLSAKRGLDLYGNFSTDPKTGIHYSNRSWDWGTTYGSSAIWSDEELDAYMDPCSLEEKEAMEAAYKSANNKPPKLLTYDGHRDGQCKCPSADGKIYHFSTCHLAIKPSEDKHPIPRPSPPYNGSSRWINGKLWIFSNQGGWKRVDE